VVLSGSPCCVSVCLWVRCNATHHQTPLVIDDRQLEPVSIPNILGNLAGQLTLCVFGCWVLSMCVFAQHTHTQPLPWAESSSDGMHCENIAELKFCACVCVCLCVCLCVCMILTTGAWSGIMTIFTMLFVSTESGRRRLPKPIRL
jgi:hypothetical protein